MSVLKKVVIFSFVTTVFGVIMPKCVSKITDISWRRTFTSAMTEPERVTTVDETRRLFRLVGLSVVKLEYIRRTDTNKKTGKSWDRVWIQGSFVKRSSNRRLF